MTIDTETLGDEIARTCAAIDKTEHRMLSMLREFDEASGWASSGQTSCAAWLSWRCGMALGAARERMRVAHKLAELPLTDAAFAAGQLSYSKVRALTRIADAESETILVEQAGLMTAAQLEKHVRYLRRCRLADEAVSEVEPERRYRQRTTDDGTVRITIELPADEAAVVAAALDARAEAPNRRAEALVAMAEETLRGDAPDRSPAEVVVCIDAERGTTSDGEVLSAECCKRILCDAGLVAVIEGEPGRAIDVGRKRRTISAALRRALASRDRGCRFPGCDNQIVDGHHVDHWANGGTTSLDNLVCLCRRHHRFVHEGGGQVSARDDGSFEFRDSRGDVIAAAPQRHGARGLDTGDIDPWAAVAQSDNPKPIDWPHVIDVTTSALGWQRRQ